jgi:hypothetical protein
MFGLYFTILESMPVIPEDGENETTGKASFSCFHS